MAKTLDQIALAAARAALMEMDPGAEWKTGYGAKKKEALADGFQAGFSKQRAFELGKRWAKQARGNYPSQDKELVKMLGDVQTDDILIESWRKGWASEQEQ